MEEEKKLDDKGECTELSCEDVAGVSGGVGEPENDGYQPDLAPTINFGRQVGFRQDYLPSIVPFPREQQDEPLDSMMK